MNDLVRHTFGKVFTPPPMPADAYPPGNRMVPGMHAALELAWQGMFYQTLTTGIVLGAVAMLGLIVAVLLRGNIARMVGDYLKGLAHAS